MSRTLRGVWSRRWTLLPLLLLTVLVVGGTVTVVSFAAAAGTSRLLSLPLLLIGLVAVPGTARELALARRGEVALARLRGLRRVALVRLLMVEPLVVLASGGVVGLLLGLVAARVATAVWAAGATDTTTAAGLVVGAGIVVVALVAVVLGSATTLREPLSDQVSAGSRPRPGSVPATFGSVLVVAAAVVAVYRSRVGAGPSGASDWVVLAGPALVGLACGEAVVWLVRLTARLLVPLTAGRGLGGFLASRRVARVADSVSAVRLLVAASVVAGLAFTGAQQVHSWTDQTARLQAGAPLQITLDGTADQAIDLTHRLDPHGRYLMAAVLVPGTGALSERRAFLDTDRYARVVGDFYAGTPAADVGARVAALGGTTAGLAIGDTVSLTARGVAPRTSGTLRPRLILGYRDDNGRPSQLPVALDLGLDGAPATMSVALPSCTTGCVVTQLTFLTRRSEPYPWVLSQLQVGDTDALHLDWTPGTRPYPGAAKPGPEVVTAGLLVTAPAPREYDGNTEITRPRTSPVGSTPVLATDSVRWTDGPPTLDSPGGDERQATVLRRYAGLPLVQRDGVLADLPRAAAGSPPTVPAAEVMVLARADTPARLLAGLRADQRGPVRTLADIHDRIFEASHSAQSGLYATIAICCLLVALLVLATAVGRQRRSWSRDLAALRLIGVDRARLRGAGRVEVVSLVVATALGTAAGSVAGVRLLLGHLHLVDVPAHAVPLRAGLAAAPLGLAVVAAAVIVAVVVGRGRRITSAASRPAILRDDA